jgi:hypothetical protein
MKKFLMTVVALMVLVSPAVAKDVLFVVLEDAKGKTSAHHQLSSTCEAFLDEFQKQKKEGTPVHLTFEDPPATGKVLEAYCIKPDGTVLGEETGKPRGHRRTRKR